MSRQWFYSCEAWKPGGSGETWEVGVTEGKFRRIQENGHTTKLCRLALVKDVVSDPIAIVKGWGRPETDDCYTYIGQPGRDLQDITIERPPPKGMEFVVFVQADGTIDDWTWRPKTGENPDLPDGIDGDVIWLRT
jgi:hypothetical protein